MQSNEDFVDAILDKIEKENSAQALLQGLNILGKLTQNIIQNPFQSKFRHLKITNNTIKLKLMVLTNIEQLLLRLGYTRQNQETYTIKDQQLGDFLEGSPAIDYKKRLLSARQTSQAAYEKQLQLVKAHKQQKRQQARRKQQARKLKEKCEYDKMERKHMKVDNSKSNTLNFGSKATTYKDIGVDLCSKKGGG